MKFLTRSCFVILIFLVLSAAWKITNQNIPFRENPIWKMAYSMYPKIQTTLNKFGLHQTRQNFLIGKLPNNYPRTLADFKAFLIQRGFEENVIAWEDPGQVFSLRKFDGKDHQLHIRVFADGEVRTHRELATEAHPIGHAIGADMTPSLEHFLPLLDKFIEHGANKN